MRTFLTQSQDVPWADRLPEGTPLPWLPATRAWEIPELRCRPSAEQYPTEHVYHDEPIVMVFGVEKKMDEQPSDWADQERKQESPVNVTQFLPLF